MSFQFEPRLATSLADLDRYLGENSDPDNVAGVDTETTRLDTRRAKLVDISLSLSYGTAILIPVGHRIGNNLPLQPVIDRIKERFETLSKPAEPSEDSFDLLTSLYYNAKFDRNIKQASTKWVPPRFLDLLNLVYLANPDRKQKGLKLVAKEDLGFDMAKFETLFTPEEIKADVMDISTKSPERCVDYACADAAILIPLFRKYKPVLKEFKFANDIDMKLIDILRKIEHNGGMLINRTYIVEQMEKLGHLVATLKEQIWRMVGYEFEIGSNKQLGIALFERMNIPSPGMTRSAKNPQHKTDAESLEKLALAFPIVSLVLLYRKAVKAKETYFTKLLKLDDLKLPVRFSFNMFSAPTFRFSAPGGDPLFDGFTGINIQAVSNGEVGDLNAVLLEAEKQEDKYVEMVDEEDLLIDTSTKEETGLVSLGPPVDPGTLPYVLYDDRGRQVCIRETCKGCAARCPDKGIDVTRRLQKNIILMPSVRESFTVPEGYSMVSFDYDRQELVIGANLSQEPKWVNALSKGEDLHAQSAADAYGIPLEKFLELQKTNPMEYDQKRGIGKILNFAIFYGATAYTISNKANLSKPAGEQIYDRYKRGHPVLFNWIEKVHLFSRKNGYTTTFFGRKRWLKEFYDNPDRKIQQFADRSSVNTAVQGTGAEVTRIAMVRVDALFKRLGITRKEAYFVMQLHDELSFAIKDELISTLSPQIADEMAFNVKSWAVQLSVEPKVGKVWGMQKKIKADVMAEWRAKLAA